MFQLSITNIKEISHLVQMLTNAKNTHSHERKMDTISNMARFKIILVLLHSSHIGVFKVKKSIILNDQAASSGSLRID